MRGDRLLTVPEVASILRVHPETVRRLLRDGRLHGHMPVSPRAGWRIPESEVQRLLTSSDAPSSHTDRAEQ